MIITIDGPSASGKSTIGFLLSCKLNFYYLNTGNLYRAIAYVLLKCPKLTINNIINDLNYLFSCETNFQIYYKEQNITNCLKEAEIASYASIISLNNELRNELLIMQRKIANNKNIIVDGRDAGTIVFPNADYKFFITASLEIRAERWRKDQKRIGNTISKEEAINFISERDFRDSNRAIAPLTIAKDAIVIDTSSMNLDDILEIMLNKIKS